MIKTATLLFFMIFSGIAFSQNTVENSFVIRKNSSAYTNQFISKSISEASFENYRDKEKSVSLVFSNGIEIELLSAKELQSTGLQVNPDLYENKPEFALVRECTLLNSGQILMAASPASGTKFKSTKP